jgi:hypothetical protein
MFIDLNSKEIMAMHLPIYPSNSIVNGIIEALTEIYSSNLKIKIFLILDGNELNPGPIPMNNTHRGAAELPVRCREHR